MQEAAQAAILTQAVPPNWTVSVFADEVDSDFDSQIDEIKRSGLRSFDLRSAFGKNVLDLNEQELVIVKDVARRENLHIASVASPVNKRGYDPEDRTHQFERLARAVHIAHFLGSPRVRIFSPLMTGGTAAPTYEDVRDWLGDQIAVAEGSGVILVHENDQDAFGAFPDNARRLLDDLDCPYFKAAFDFGNAVNLGYPAIPHWFPWIVPHLDTLHIKDGRQGEMLALPAGQGDGRIADVLRILIDAGWTGTLSIEPHLHANVLIEPGEVSLFRTALSALNEVIEAVVS